MFTIFYTMDQVQRSGYSIHNITEHCWYTDIIIALKLPFEKIFH